MAHIPDRPKPSEYTSNTDAMVRIVVGHERKEFWVHRTLICAEIPFFEACVGNKNFKEGNEGEVQLPEDDAAAFGILLNFVYGGKVDIPGTIEQEEVAARAYVLADKFSMVRCKNTIMTAIMTTRFRDPTSYIQLIQRLATEDFRPELLLWRWYIRRAANLYAYAYCALPPKYLNEEQECLLEGGGELAIEIVKDMMFQTRFNLMGGPPCIERYCMYHCHNDENSGTCEVRDERLTWTKPTGNRFAS